MVSQDAVVVWNRNVAPGYFRMGLSCPTGYDAAKAGQFVMVQAGLENAPLLRRPFSLLGLIEERERVAGIEILFKVVGKGTELLSHCKKGDGLAVLGPLGNAFQVSKSCSRLILVAGGVGVPPIRFLATSLLKRVNRPAHCVVFIGGRSKEDLVCITEFDLPGFLLDISTDDGSFGHQGVVTRSLERALDEGPVDLICACGPEGMLKAVSAIAVERNVPCQVSIESMMACGMGACLGCAVQSTEDRSRYLHVCTDGPVFDTQRLGW